MPNTRQSTRSNKERYRAAKEPSQQSTWSHWCTEQGDRHSERKDHNTQDVRICQLEDKVGILTAGLSHAVKQADNNEQYSRRYCLRIKGISKEKDESSTKCIDKVVKVCESLKVNITKADIDRAHRVGEDRSTMIVKFFRLSKEHLYTKQERIARMKISTLTSQKVA